MVAAAGRDAEVEIYREKERKRQMAGAGNARMRGAAGNIVCAAQRTAAAARSILRKAATRVERIHCAEEELNRRVYPSRGYYDLICAVLAPFNFNRDVRRNPQSQYRPSARGFRIKAIYPSICP